MTAWGLAALNGHYECFNGRYLFTFCLKFDLKFLLINKVLEQIITTISGRKQFFEMQDNYGRTFMHLAAISG
jgi:hypothetical protein